MPILRVPVVTVTKPPYRIPNVPEIAALAGTNGLTAVSTFAGAGGSSTGYRWAGYDVRWASEFLTAAADSYEANWPSTTVDRRDVRDVGGEDVLAACGIAHGDLDLFDGSPPCQPFSSAGRREKNWRREIAHGDGTVNRGGSEDLVREWVRLIAEMRPRAAVMENVRGMTIGKAKGYLLEVLEAVRSLGYNAEARLLDGQWLGVPQRRVRVFVVAVRDDVGTPAWPAPLPYRYTIADACPWIVKADMRRWGTERTPIEVDEPSPTVVATGAAQNRPLVIVENTEVGGFGNVARIDPAREVAPTITASGHATNTLRGASGDGCALDDEHHRAQTDGVAAPRKFTIAEVRRLCGFPDDYVLTGGYAEQWARLGNSVPPPMSRAVGLALAPVLAR